MRPGFTKFNKSIFLTAALALLFGCATQKKKEDLGAVGKAYQNMTARYNGYYNATVLLQESTLALEQQHQDNYNQILPIYKYVEADNPKAEAANLDNAIKKVSVDVNLHRASHWVDDCYLLLGQAQFLKQDYESAKETFEFMAAEFDPVEVEKREAKAKSQRNKKKAVKKGKSSSKASTASGDEEEVKLSKKERDRLAKKKKKEREKERKQKIRETKKRRKSGKAAPRKEPKTSQPAAKDASKEKITDTAKEDEADKDAAPENALPAPGSISLGDLKPQVAAADPEGYFLKHRPAHQEGLLWLARTYIERESFTNADRLLAQLEQSPSTFHDIRSEAAVARADFFLKQKMYDKAEEPLRTAISLSGDRKMEARLGFILGQIHKKAGRGSEAYAAFDQVVKLKPDFEMEFSARLNLATAGVNSPEESVQQLEKMLKEEKNREQKDKIYYALAQIALQRGDRAGTIKNLELSLNNSSADISQKAESYLQLADLYFEDQSFVKAKLYFDSTLLVLNPLDERYDRVNRLANNLDGIAQNLQIIALQDSLLRISRMTNEERRELAYAIKKKQDEDKLNALKAQAKQGASSGKAPSVPLRVGAQQGGISNQSNFFAYDDKSVKAGQRDFQRKWGGRPLEDNWRRSNRQSFTSEGEPIAEQAKPGDVLTQEEIDQIFKDVPDLPAELAQANREIEAAYFALGRLYRDKLQNYPKSIEALNKLLERNPETQYQLDALYYIYLSYQDLGDAANAAIYYDKIVNGYPNTHYAKLLSDPDYLQSVMAQSNKLDAYYKETYQVFEQRQFQMAYDRISKVNEMFGSTNPLQPRFALLSAMCVGNLNGRENYVQALKELIGRYAETPEATRAKEILRLLGENIGSGPGQRRDLPTAQGQIGPYKPEDNKLHYVIVVFKTEISLNDAKVAISDYNNKYHSLQSLRINNIYLDKTPIIAIRRYKDKKEAMDYYNGVQKNSKDFLDKSKFDYEIFAVGQDNYRELLRVKDVDQYRAFFETTYLR